MNTYLTEDKISSISSFFKKGTHQLSSRQQLSQEGHAVEKKS